MQFGSNQLDKSMQNRHLTVSQFSESESLLADTPTSSLSGVLPQFEGYLFKRTSKGFKTWNRRWFYLRDNQLLYAYALIHSIQCFNVNNNNFIFSKRDKDEVPTVMEDDLRICTVRPVNDSDRRFCFEVISPMK